MDENQNDFYSLLEIDVQEEEDYISPNEENANAIISKNFLIIICMCV